MSISLSIQSSGQTALTVVVYYDPMAHACKAAVDLLITPALLLSGSTFLVIPVHVEEAIAVSQRMTKPLSSPVCITNLPFPTRLSLW